MPVEFGLDADIPDGARRTTDHVRDAVPALVDADLDTLEANSPVTSRRTALVTGGSRGIGLAIAHRLASEGYALTLAARREPGLLAAADELRAAGAEVHPVVANLASEDDVRRLTRPDR